jgi:hypothetical protein
MAASLLPVIVEARREGDLVSLDDIAKALGLEKFGLENVLQEICRNNRDRLPYFEIQWSVTDENMRRGRVGGGAQFVTAEGVRTLDAARWVEEQRSQFQHDDLQRRIEWDRLSGGSYFQLLPRTTWRSIVFEDTQDLVMIDETDGGYEVGIQLSETGVKQLVGTYASMAEAMRVGGDIVYEAGNTADDKVLASMGLSGQEWELGYGEDGEPTAFSVHGSRYMIAFIPFDCDDPSDDGDGDGDDDDDDDDDDVEVGGEDMRETGRWVFYVDDEEVTDAVEPAELGEYARGYIDVPKPG